jgi:MFS family permease
MISIAGLLLFSLAVTLKSFDLLIIGRAIFGIGAEAQNIWIATIISIWFYYGEISFAAAWIGCAGKLGSILADFLTPYSIEAWGGSIEGSFWISAVINVAMLAVILIMNSIDSDNDLRRRQIRYKKKREEVKQRLNKRTTQPIDKKAKFGGYLSIPSTNRESSSSDSVTNKRIDDLLYQRIFERKPQKN